MTAHRSELLSQISQSEEIRKRHVLSVYDPQYQFVQAERFSPRALEELWQEVEEDARSVTGNEGNIVVQNFAYDLAGKTLKIAGDVHGVGSRSMTVLAAFVDALQESPSVASVIPPRFERQDDPKTGPHSPFDLSLTLR